MAAEYKNTLPKKNKNKFFAGGVLANSICFPKQTGFGLC